jgi:hypothetical protein
MPYVMEKGPYFSVVESKLANLQTRKDVLLQLRSGTPIHQLVGLDSQTLSGDGITKEQRVEHLNRDWFGMRKVGSNWQKQPNQFPTGFWCNYQGDPEVILREAMERAIEVSFDLGHGDPPPNQPANASRAWPIDVYWICQGPWFQAWVVWRKADDSPSGGHVTVVITTPATTGHPLTTRITRPAYNNPATDKNADYAFPPPAARRANDRGMWVVGHEDYDKTIVHSTAGSRRGEVTDPRIEWRAKNTNAICVAPAEWEGGVLASGRRYVAGNA